MPSVTIRSATFAATVLLGAIRNEQLTADSGGPTLLGDFKGRVFEFDAKNRVEGDAVFLTFSVPLSIKQKPAPEQDWTAAEQPQ